ncbi:hypothetical protein EVAR_80021_1 [Eumeta japonica]|uniref:Uncharacterized protein n=1 Tax=Eumeta variegata TaxID=151549 RepID=A0A4C1WKE8_EUMVA|nr:hypothetical protein EVAR_80021_1 [Eumeta japonica]
MDVEALDERPGRRGGCARAERGSSTQSGIEPPRRPHSPPAARRTTVPNTLLLYLGYNICTVIVPYETCPGKHENAVFLLSSTDPREAHQGLSSASAYQRLIVGAAGLARFASPVSLSIVAPRSAGFANLGTYASAPRVVNVKFKGLSSLKV